MENYARTGFSVAQGRYLKIYFIFSKFCCFKNFSRFTFVNNMFGRNTIFFKVVKDQKGSIIFKS